MKIILVSDKLVWTQLSWRAIVISALSPVIKSLANIVSRSLTEPSGWKEDWRRNSFAYMWLGEHMQGGFQL